MGQACGHALLCRSQPPSSEIPGLNKRWPDPEEGPDILPLTLPTREMDCLYLFPSGKRYRNIKTKTTRLKNSFFPRAVQSISPLLRT
ncbi:hypothetical protein L3Q82_018899 [Scortum barcoo]|uniref:Uncharacterized protein n=1 Tax=Scortum barcoo TaxID=214431 RepID=A0ACB8VGI5_9TELE|nr:hypothetical protein L3Q82_018899 [Scortum barcoo]